jgi:hypothetical protein
VCAASQLCQGLCCSQRSTGWKHAAAVGRALPTQGRGAPGPRCVLMCVLRPFTLCLPAVQALLTILDSPLNKAGKIKVCCCCCCCSSGQHLSTAAGHGYVGLRCCPAGSCCFALP